MSRTEVTEGSSANIVVDFLDANGVAAVPSAVTYRIDCVTTGQIVRADTALTPAASITVAVVPADTQILSSANSVEEKRLTVKATFGAGDNFNGEFVYYVKNLVGV